jgi:glycosyltransferase involved in cell wall biosynthesis
VKIFYISYWGISEGLTVSTVLPNLKILSEDERVDSIEFFTVERSEDRNFKDRFIPINKVHHHPIHSKNLGFFLFTKIADWLRIRKTIKEKAAMVRPDLVICRGAMAGAFGTMLFKKFGIPYVVESFEPHADYMAESGVWKKNGLRYRLQKKTEAEIKKYAKFLITVSHNYCEHLSANEGIAKERLKMVPCTVNPIQFQYNSQARQLVREKLGISADTRVGIYLGKFGSIYYDKEAFEVFKAAEQYFDNFFIVLLSPTDEKELTEKLNAVKFPLQKAWIGTVAHKEVPSYLSAADFAFSTIKPADCRRFCSPVKDGEYWANGLPILLPDMVGDDSEIIKTEGGGAIIDVNNPESLSGAFTVIDEAIQKGISGREEISALATKHRNPDVALKVYKEILDRLSVF